MGRYPQADAVLSAGDQGQNPGSLFQNQGQGAGPETFSEFPCRRRNIPGPFVELGGVSQMNNQGMICRPAFKLENSLQGNRTTGITTESVNRFGGKGNHLADSKQVHCGIYMSGMM